MPVATQDETAALLAGVSQHGAELFYGGAWHPPHSTQRQAVWDPSTGGRILDVVTADEVDVDRAVQAAAGAGPAWAALTVEERGARFADLAELIEQHQDEICRLDALDAGLPVGRMTIDVRGALRALAGWPGLALSLRGEVLPHGERLHYTRYAPYGVVAKIVAYNHPFLFAVKGILAALIAGNTVVLKPADQTPLSALLLASFAERVLPAGVLNVVTGGVEAGTALTTHPLVRRIAFTGSARTGAAIQRGAASDGMIRTLSLELGGKNAMIVFPDVDPRRVAAEAVKAMNLRANQGQSCGSTSRIFVHREVYDDFCAELAAAFERLTLGPASDPDVDMGPLITPEHAARVRQVVGDAVAGGARVLTGGLDDPRVPDAGNFVAPTALTDVAADSGAACEEIFGPVVCVFAWDDEEDMLRRVNGVAYGLTASIWTDRLSTALSLADRIEAGYIWVNDSTTHYWGTPFGGWKNSGIGREESMAELLGYLQVKSVHVALAESRA